MTGIVLKLFNSFIIQNFNYLGWTKVQETAILKSGGPQGEQIELNPLIKLASDILRINQSELVFLFGRFCFLNFLENSTLGELKEEEDSDIFFYSDALLSLKIKKLKEEQRNGWELDGRIKFSESEEFYDNGSLPFHEFVKGFLREGKKYYQHKFSFNKTGDSIFHRESCKITFFTPMPLEKRQIAH